MAKDREGVTVHTMNSVEGRGPVYYATIPRDTEPATGMGTDSEEAKQFLVSTLWDHFLARESPRWNHYRSADKAASPLTLECSLLGRPHLLVGECWGPAISFSEGGGKVWAALAGDESAIGIDVAGSDEFLGDYPFQRVFHPHELQHAVRLTGGNQAEAAALLWSVKEAVVKALGCAFHLVEPRHVNVYPSAGESEGYTFPVGLTGKAQERFPLAASQSLWVHSLPHGTMWLSIALLNRRTIDHE
jgi:phosphopantetheinyl transferase